MGRRRPKNSRIVPADDLGAYMRLDYPDVVKSSLALSAHGQTRAKRVCLTCGRKGTRLKIFVSDTSLRLGATPEEVKRGILSYWSCESCAEIPTPQDVIERALVRQAHTSKKGKRT